MRGHIKNIFFQLISWCQLNQLGILAQQNRLQILAYHALCLPSDKRFPWVSPAFVSTDQFDDQMKFIRRKMNPIALSTAMKLLQVDDPLPPKSIVVTFDDGYANNLLYGQEIIDRYSIPATIFLATDHISNMEFFHFDKRRCLEFWIKEGLIDNPADIDLFNALPDYKTTSIVEHNKLLNQLWLKSKDNITIDQKRLLIPLSWDQVKNGSKLFEWGAHTCSHAILSQLTAEQRQNEIGESIKEIQQHIGSSFVPFSYPNGTANDFGAIDIKFLLESEASCAVTTLPGNNSSATPIYQLKRNRSISIQHTQAIFEAELSGIMQILKNRGKGECD